MSIKIIRKTISLLRKPISFDSVQTEPVSRDFGFSRGTPIDRYYIDHFLNSHKLDLKGSALEISEDSYLRKFDSGITSFEILHYDDTNRKATIIGDLTKAETLPKDKVDCFVCTQTLNFIFDVDKAIEGCWQVLKENGVLLATVSGLSQISRYDMDRWGDYWRFTDLTIRKLFETHFGTENVSVECFGNVFAASSLLKGIAVEDLADKELLDVNDKDYQVVIGIRAVKRSLDIVGK